MGQNEEGKQDLATVVQLLVDLVAPAPRADVRGVLNWARRRKVVSGFPA